MEDEEYYNIEDLVPFDVDLLQPKDVEIINRIMHHNNYLQEVELLTEIKNDIESEELIFCVQKDTRNSHTCTYNIPHECDIITAIYILMEDEIPMYLLLSNRTSFYLTVTTSLIPKLEMVTIHGEEYIQIIPSYPYLRRDSNTMIISYSCDKDRVVYVQGIKCSERMKTRLLEELKIRKEKLITMSRMINYWLDEKEI